jgi:type IV pilus assembly protein PilB
VPVPPANGSGSTDTNGAVDAVTETIVAGFEAAGQQAWLAAESAQVGEWLVERGRLSRTQLAEAELQQGASGKALHQLLIELGLADERAVAEALGDVMGFPLIDLRQIEPDPDAVMRLPEGHARWLVAVPIRIVDGRIDVAVADPSNPALSTDLVAAVAPLQPSLAVAPASDIVRAIDNSYRALAGVGSLVEAFEASEAIRQVETAERVVADDAPVVQVVNLIVTQGVRDRASDVHIEPQGGRVRVRFRIDGALHDVLALPDAMGPAIVSRIKIMAEMNIVERRRAQDGQMVVEVDGREVDIRIATSPTIWGEKVVLRLLDRSRTLYRLDDLGMSARTHEQFSKMMRSPYGMVICAGPTGSGKTTTLYATLTEINQTERNVTTIEDPVEYVFPSINQIQINEQAGVTFAAGLRAILRQDPDVILVGEVRDAETARIAVESALTGHFVLSSLHATDASSALQRLVDMGIEPFLIASTVIGVVSQRLVRRICDQCREPYEPPIEEIAFYKQAGGTSEDKVTFTQGVGCAYCSRTGYRERAGVFELLPVTDAIKTLLVDGSSLDELRATAKREGMTTLLDAGIELVDQGVATIPEIIRSIYIL